MQGRWGALSGHIEKRRGKWQVVLELGEQPFRQCAACRDDTRADGRRRGAPRWWLVDGSPPRRCPDCGDRLVEEFGRRQRRLGGFERKTEATEELTQILSDQREGKQPATRDVTFTAWFETWLDQLAMSVQIGELAPRTAASYESHVRNHLRPRFAGMNLRDLTPGDVAELMRDLQSSGRSPVTATRVRATLSRSLSDAMRHELVHRNVAQIARPPKTVKREPSAFSPAEFERILGVLADHRLGAAFTLAAWTGLRASEVRGLKWRDIDFDLGRFRIERGLHRLSESAERVVPMTGFIESRPKTELSGSDLPLAATAVDLLKRHREIQRREFDRLGLTVTADTYVFTSTVGTPLEPSNLNQVWRRILRRADVEYKAPDGRGRGLHELRRTFATRLRDIGIPLEDVQRLGRWSSPQVLLALYAASDAERLRGAADAAVRALGGGRDET